jgi:hypothetical protein
MNSLDDFRARQISAFFRVGKGPWSARSAGKSHEAVAPFMRLTVRAEFRRAARREQRDRQDAAIMCILSAMFIVASAFAWF